MITGRSDATLNRGGVRLGTGEFYAVVEELAEVADSLVVHLEDAEGGRGRAARCSSCSPTGRSSTTSCARGSRGALRARALAAPRARHDRGGAGDPAHADRQEARDAGQADPARRAPDEVASRDALADPAAIDAFVAYARSRASDRPARESGPVPKNREQQALKTVIKGRYSAEPPPRVTPRAGAATRSRACRSRRERSAFADPPRVGERVGVALALGVRGERFLIPRPVLAACLRDRVDLKAGRDRCGPQATEGVELVLGRSAECVEERGDGSSRQ